MSRLVEGLDSQLAKERIHRLRRVRAIAPIETRAGRRYRLIFQENGDFEADAVVLALPAAESARVLHSMDSVLSAHLASIPYASSLIVGLVYGEEVSRRLPPGFGFLIPYAEGGRLRACTFVGNKFRGRVPPDFHLLRCFLGGVRDEAVLELNDQDAVALVERELGIALGLTHRPLDAGVYRWPAVMPQYTVGHLARLRKIDSCLQPHPGLYLAGNAYGGVGVPDCIRSGRLAATASLTLLTGSGGSAEGARKAAGRG